MWRKLKWWVFREVILNSSTKTPVRLWLRGVWGRYRHFREYTCGNDAWTRAGLRKKRG